jgi:hypothetical protein
MSPAPKQSAPSESAASAKTPGADEVERMVKQIQELNEQLLAKGKELGLGFLDAYEQTLRALLDLETKATGSTGVDWIADVARAQADFVRKVTDSYISATRDILKR